MTKLNNSKSLAEQVGEALKCEGKIVYHTIGPMVGLKELQPIHAALVECVKALEQLEKDYPNHWDPERNVAKQGLLLLRKVVE